jgi:acyl-CoA synthetase (AMP-forming)/AMP-acid ligase II/acyl carrier protein
MLSDPLTGQDRCYSDVLAKRAEAHPDRTAFIWVDADGGETNRLGYGELHDRVERYAAALSARDMAGSRALMLFEPGLAFVVAFLGCLRAGVIAVPANVTKPGRTSWDRLVAVAKDSGAACILSEQRSTSKFVNWFASSEELSRLEVLCLDDAQYSPINGRERPPRNTPAFLQYTSGSTGNPKGTVVTFGNLAANAALMSIAFDIDFDARIVTWLPPHHDLGLIGNVLQVLWDGAQCIMMPPVSFVQNPARWLEVIGRYRATLSMAPNFAYELCVRRIPPERRGTFDLSSWQVAVNASEPIRASSVQRFIEAFRESGYKASCMQPAYGLAEATLIVSSAAADAAPSILCVESEALDQGRLVLSTADRRSREIVSSGSVRSPQHVSIVHPETRRVCESGEIGEIWVSGPCVASGYWGRQEETQRTFGARTADGQGSFLRTGDLGIVFDGELYVTGRIKEVIIIRGRKIYPQDIEATVQRSHDALRPAGGAAFAVEREEGESIVVVQEIERTALASIDRHALVSIISQAVFAEHDVAIADVVLVKPEVIPKTSSGKIQRVLCRDLYSRGELDQVVQGRSAIGRTAGTKPADVSTHLAGSSDAGETAQTVEPVADARAATGPVSVDAIIAMMGAWLVQNGLKSPSDPRQTFAELGIDSIGAVELADFLQKQLHIEIDQTILYAYPTLDALATYLFSQCVPAQRGADGAAAERASAEDTEIPGW